MFTHTIILAATLTVTPSTPTEVLLPPLADLETVGDRGSLTVYAYDENGVQIGSIGLFIEPDGTILSISDYSDGWAQIMVLPDGTITFDPDSSLTPEQVADRAGAFAQALGDDQQTLGYQPHPEKGWVPCAIGVVSTVAALAAVNPWALVLTINAACTCIPHLSQEFAELHCPGY